MDTSERIFYIVETQQEIYPFLLGSNVTVLDGQSWRRKSIAVDHLKVGDTILSRSGKEEKITAIRLERS